MKNRPIALLLALSLAAPAAAAPVVVFDETFGDEVGTYGTVTSFTAFSHFEVTDGSVDLIKTGDYGISCATDNGCVDLDGNAAGYSRIQSKPFDLLPGAVYSIEAWISGNQRGGNPDVATIEVDVDTSTPSLAWTAPFAPLAYSITLSSGFSDFSFAISHNAVDFVGPILDRVRVSYEPAVVPLPAALPLLAGGLAALGFAARRRRNSTTVSG